MFRDRDQHPALSLRTSLDLEMSPNQSQETNQGSEAAEKAGDSELFAIKITDVQVSLAYGHQVGSGCWARNPEAVPVPCPYLLPPPADSQGNNRVSNASRRALP